MKFKTLAIGAIAALLLAGCNNNTNPEPAPSPEPEPVGPVGPVVPTEWSSSIQTAMNQSLGFVLPFMVLSSSATFASLESQGYPGFYQISDSQSAGLLADYVALLDADDNLSDFEREPDTSVPSVDYMKQVKTGETAYTETWHTSEVYVAGSGGLSIVFGSSDTVVYTDWSPEQKTAMTTNIGEVLPFFDGFTADDEFSSESSMIQVGIYYYSDEAIADFNDYVAKFEAPTSGWSGEHHESETYFGTDIVGTYSKPSEMKVGGKDATLDVQVYLEDASLLYEYELSEYAYAIYISAQLSALYDEWPATEIATALGDDVTSVVPAMDGSSFKFEEIEYDDEVVGAKVTVLNAGESTLEAYVASLRAAHFTVYEYLNEEGTAVDYYYASPWDGDYYMYVETSSSNIVFEIYASSEVPASADTFPAESIATYFGIENEDLINEIVPFTSNADYGYKKGVYQDLDEGINQFYVKAIDPAFGTEGDKLDVVYQAALETALYEITPATSEYPYTQAEKEIEDVGRVFVEFYLDEQTGVFEAYFEMSEAAAPITGTSFVKVTSEDDLVSGGNYLIVCGSEGVAFDGSLDTLDAVSNNIEVAISDGVIAATSELIAASFTITEGTGSNAGKYAIVNASGKSIYRTATSNGLNVSDTPSYTNTIEFDISGNAIIMGNNGSDVQLQYNKASDQNRFRYFKSAQTAIQLYKLVTL